MNYIVCKKFNQKGLDQIFNLRKGTRLTESNGILYHNDQRVCYASSQNAYDFFARNDDNNGEQRYNLIQDIKDTIAGYVSEYNEEVAAINNGDLTDEQKEEEIASVVDKSLQAFEAIRALNANLLKPFDNIFSYNFYNADISVLEHIQEII